MLVVTNRDSSAVQLSVRPVCIGNGRHSEDPHSIELKAPHCFEPCTQDDDGIKVEYPLYIIYLSKYINM